MFLYWIFWRWKIRYFWAKKLMEIWYFLITEKLFFWSFREWKIRPFLSQKVAGKMIFTDYWKVLILTFSGMGNTVFFESKSWWKVDIYWLLKSSCFDLFGNGKYSLFWVKKLMERWYLLVAEKFLVWTFWWWEIRPFFQLKSWRNDDIYLIFLSFPWYSRAWERWFFTQCLWMVKQL